MPIATSSPLIAFLPEWILLAGMLVLFVLTLGLKAGRHAGAVSLGVGCALVLAVLLSFRAEADLFDGAYRVDLFSQWIKLVLAVAYSACVVIAGRLEDVRESVRPEFCLLLATSVCGFIFLASSVELVALVVALELSSYPLFLMIAMRRERTGQRVQMESAVKYMLFGIAATGVMLFGMSYLYGLTGTMYIPLLVERLVPQMGSPLAIAGIGLTLAAFFYKLAVFPFHFWTPDVYEGASNETAAVIATLPKLAAVLLMLRFAGGGSPEATALVGLFAVLAVGSMFYGNLLALAQRDLKRLLGFSAIAHAGYTLVGIAALDGFGFTAALYYVTGYVFAVLACFLVIARVSNDGHNVPVAGLAGLHRRSPLLAVTLLAGIFSLAGIPPFAGFMGKFTLLSAALQQGLLWLVLLTVLNAVIAVYYYLRVIRAAFFGDAADDVLTPIALKRASRVLCIVLILALLALGLVPGAFLDLVAGSLNSLGVIKTTG